MKSRFPGASRPYTPITFTLFHFCQIEPGEVTLTLTPFKFLSIVIILACRVSVGTGRRKAPASQEMKERRKKGGNRKSVCTSQLSEWDVDLGLCAFVHAVVGGKQHA